jgi:hypothetical protein
VDYSRTIMGIVLIYWVVNPIGFCIMEEDLWIYVSPLKVTTLRRSLWPRAGGYKFQ